tara:strand:- start:7928 stop:8356 length:429 start_codon:yes stop_codon:yes gene_type:complete
MYESVNKTWFIDIDGTLVKHLSNDSLDVLIEDSGDDSHKKEKPIDESVKFLNKIPKEDTIVITTARDARHSDHTLRMLDHFKIRYDRVIFDLRAGPRVLVNDIKPIGSAGNAEPLKTAYAINVNRDEGIPSEDLMAGAYSSG